MMNLFSKLSNILTSHGSSFFAAYTGEYASSFMTNMFNWIIEWFLRLLWSVFSLCMTVMDTFEYITFSFLGLDMSITDFSKVNEIVNVQALTNTFRALAGLAIVLMLVFTIIAIAKQEYQNMISGFTKTDKDGNMLNPNPKMPYVNKIVKNIVLIFAMPAMIYMMFAGVTSVLNSFNLALKQNPHSTIAGQVLASSTFEANKYRLYANTNTRIPIIINAYDSSKANYDNIDDMALKIASVEVQASLRDVANKLVTKSFSSFNDTLVYKNNSYYNAESYSKLHEQFICTAEQYQVMADFVDYAQQSGMTYYIKAINDPGVDWKYVSSAIYNQANNELTIEYVNSNVVNNGYQASAAYGTNDKTYTITYTPSANVTSPISDALESIKAMLGLGDYSENLYNVLERQEGFTNLVTWANEKAYLKLSDEFDLNDRSTWSDTDEILIYEYYRWSSNNSLRDYTIDDLINGIEWDVNLLSYQEYYDKVDIYSKEINCYTVCLNNNHYIVHKDERKTDRFGNPYYVLTSHSNENMTFLNKAYTTVEALPDSEKIVLKLSAGFNINDVDTWSVQDEILIYEYFSDTNYSNTLRQYKFDEFLEGNGVSFTKYKIVNHYIDGSSETIYAVLLNNTYYKLNNSDMLAALPNTHLLKMHKNNEVYLYYYYYLKKDEAIKSLVEDRYNLSYDLVSNYLKTGTITDGKNFTTLDLSKDENGNYKNLNDSKYAEFTFKLSSNFSYSDIATWSFRDILIFSLYIEGLKSGGTYGKDISYLKNYGIKGEVGQFEGRYVFKIDGESDEINDTFKYLIISDISNISTEGLYELDIEETRKNNNFSVSNNHVFLNYENYRDTLLPIAENNNERVETYSYHFKFSDGFKMYEKSTWTLGDYILVYCSNLGLIGSIDTIKEKGYHAVAYSKLVDVNVLVIKHLLGLEVANMTNQEILEKYGVYLTIENNAILSGYVYLKETNQIETNLDNYALNLVRKQSYYDSEEVERYYRFGNDENTALYFRADKVSFVSGTTYDKLDYALKQPISSVFYYSNINDNPTTDIDEHEEYLFAENSEFCKYWLSKDHDTYENTSTTLKTILKFSEGFEASNYDTWTQADFVLYYMCRTLFDNKQIQNYINNGVEADILNFIDVDYNGSSTTTKVLRIKDADLLLHYTAFYKLYDKVLSYYSMKNTNVLSYEIKFDKTGLADLIYEVKSSSGLASFVWTDYYYYQSTSNDAFNEIKDHLLNINEEEIQAIENFDTTTGIEFGTINLKLSNGFDLTNPETWTITDFIVLTEYSKDIKNNDFEGVSFENLKLKDNYYDVYVLTEGGRTKPQAILAINNTYYNLTTYANKDTNEYFVLTEPLKVEVKITNLQKSTVNNFILKVPKETISFSVNPQIKYTIPNTNEYTAVYKDSSGKSVYITPNYETKKAYQLNLALLDRYEVAPQALKVSWPQKLMNDMLVMYPDLNWNTLLAEGNWVDALGEYSSAFENNAFVSEGNSANITAIGLVLAEFFLSAADKSVLGYADFEYSSTFDQDVINSLMLSLLGEEAYDQLKMQAEIFMELFNTTFATILDDIAAEYSVNIADGDAVAVSTYLYKAFLATQLLSSNIGEYLYTVANRVYAQYTIYESLASAAGKYIEYQKYIKGESKSLILRIGTEYYDVTGYVKKNADADILTFLPNIELNNINDIILDTEDPDDIVKINKIISSHKVKIKRSEKIGEYSILDKIIAHEISLNDPQSDFNETNQDLESSGEGIEIEGYLSEKNIYLRINSRYYDITSYAVVNGDYNLTYSYADYIDSLYKESNSNMDNVLDYLFEEMPFAPSSYLLTEAISQGKGNYLIKVGYNLDKNDSTTTVLDFIIEKYREKYSESINTGGLISDYKDKDPNGNSIAEGLKNDNYSYLAEIYVVNNQNAFTYSTFRDLVYYENQSLKNENATPMYTFNMQRVYRALLEKENGQPYQDNIWEKLWFLINLNVGYKNRILRTETERELAYKEQLLAKYNQESDKQEIIDNWDTIWAAMETKKSVIVLKIGKAAREAEFRRKIAEKANNGEPYDDKIWEYIWKGISLSDLDKYFLKEEDKKKNYIEALKNEIKNKYWDIEKYKNYHNELVDDPNKEDDITDVIWDLVKFEGLEIITQDILYPWDSAYDYVYDRLAKIYNDTYKNGEKIADSSPYYCYLFENYYAIHYEVDDRGEDDPIYLKLFKDFLDGDITRWNILATEDISGTTQYIPDYNEYKNELTWQKIKAAFNMMSLFNNQIAFSNELGQDIINEINSGKNIFKTVADMVGDINDETEIFTTKDFVYQTIIESHERYECINNECHNRGKIYSVSELKIGFFNTKKCPVCKKELSQITTENSLFTKDYQNVFEIFESDSLVGKIVSFLFKSDDEFGKLIGLFESSEEGNSDSWNAILKIYASLKNIIDEMEEVKKLYESGESLEIAQTEKGSKVARFDGDGSGFYSEEEYEKQIGILNKFYVSLGSYIRTQRIVDSTIKSSITFTLAQYGKNYVTDYEFTFENRAYTLSSMASALRLAEYTLGGSFLVDYGIYPAFTSSSFEGIVHQSKVYDANDGMMKTKLDMWPELREFAANLAAYTAKLYYTTSFTDLATNNINAVKITDSLIDKNTENQITIEQIILDYLCDANQNLNPQTLCTLLLEETTVDTTGIEDIVLKLENLRNPTELTNETNIKITFSDVYKILEIVKRDKNNVHIAFKSIISYLLLSDEQQNKDEGKGINFEDMTFSQLRIEIMNRLIDYESNASEQSTENINRYMALLNLVSAEIRYYELNQETEQFVYRGTNLKPIDIYEKSNKVEALSYAESSDILHYYASDEKNKGSEIFAELVVNDATYISMLELANAENMPVEDLVQMEYDSIYKRTDGVYDENMGDIFVVCQFDELTSKYVPYMAKNVNTNVADQAYEEYLSRYGHLITTRYYADNAKAYPIVAKGIVTASGLPTAIRIENDKVKYYRTDISATVNINESAILNEAYSSELTTVNYTTYVPATQYLPFGDTNKMVNFIGNVNLGTVLKTDFSAYFLQTDTVFNLVTADDRGGFVILDEFSAHYQFSIQVILLMMLGFIVLFPLLYKFSVSAMRRIIDIIFLVLAFPMIISTTTLTGDSSKDNAYSKWVGQMKNALLAVFGFIIGFNCYYILSSTVLRMDFVEQSTVDSIKTIGGFGFVSLTTLNMIIRYVFLIQAVSIIKSAMNLLLPIVAGAKNANALTSAIDGKDVGDSVKNVAKDLKRFATKAMDIVNGKALIQLKDAALESMKSMIPGAKIIGSIKEDVQAKVSKIKGNVMKQMAMKHGVPESVASEFAKAYTDSENKRREYKRDARINNANKFLNTYVADGKFQPAQFSKNEHLMPVIKKAFALPEIGNKNKKQKKPKKAKGKK